MGVNVGFAEFDALAVPFGVRVGWAELDVLAGGVCVGWAEFDVLSDNDLPIPSFPQGGIGGYGSAQRWSRFSNYYDHVEKKYNIPVQVDESEEEEILMQILMEVAKHEL
jgi:hypothetical protein